MRISKMSQGEINQVLNKADEILKDFYCSFRFHQVIEQTKAEVESLGSVCNSPKREPLFGNVSNEEFLLMFHCLFNESISRLTTEEHGGETHWQEHLVYEGMEFIEIYAQGSAYIVRRIQ